MIHLIGRSLVIFYAFVGYVTAAVAVTRKLGKATAAHFNADAVAGAENIGGAPQVDLRLHNRVPTVVQIEMSTGPRVDA